MSNLRRGWRIIRYLWV